MKTEEIVSVKIDSIRRLLIKPKNTEFTFIWRAAMEVNWDNNSLSLCSPTPKEWTYENWYKQIIDGCRDEYGILLITTSKTQFENMNVELINSIKSISNAYTVNIGKKTSS